MTEITSTLQKLFSEKMHWVCITGIFLCKQYFFDRNNTYLTEIILREKRGVSQFCSCCMTEMWKPILSLSHNALGFGRNNIYISCRNYSQKEIHLVSFLFLPVMAEIIVHNRNFSKIYTPDQNYAATVIQMIERNNSIASLVHRNHFCLYWAFILTEIP